MDTAQLAGIIISVGALLPLLTSVVEQQTWSTRTRTIVGLCMSALAGLVTYVTQFGLNFSDPGTLVTTIVGVILASGAAYKTVWQPSGISGALEGGTSPKPVTPDPEAPLVDLEPEETPEIDTLPEDDLEDWEIPTEDIPDEGTIPEEDTIPEEMGMPVGFDDGSKAQ